MTGLCIIITTTNTKELAKEIARDLLSSGLSSCAQVSTIDSIYKWQGKIFDEPEYRLLIKAKKSNEVEIFTKIKAMHNYDLPQIISIDIESGDEAYLKWLKD